MPGLLPNIDPDGLQEFSVVFTDRSLNHMSTRFQQVMRDISDTLKGVYKAAAVVVVPGGGTYGMEAVARQFTNDQKALVIRNGWFSYRWTQIFEAGKIPAEHTVLKARQTGNAATAPFAPVPVEEAVARIREERPAVVFAPHVETSSGMILPESYIRALADAAHEVGALMVLDCIASGTIWVDMAATGVDVLISAPQKGWSSAPAAALVMLSEAALKRMEEGESSSFALNLKAWHGIMQAYENGGHAYYATLPTDALKAFRDAMQETGALGWDTIAAAQQELGDKVRTMLKARGIASVAAPGFEAPGVVVSYTDDPDIKSGKKFAALGVQIAAGVPLQCDEPEGFSTFRLGLFGLDKLADIDGTVKRLETALDQVF